MHRIVARTPSLLNRRVISGLIIVSLIATATWVLLHRAAPAQTASGVIIDGAKTYQTIDGFGFSEAFQRSNYLHGSQGLSPAKQQQVLDLLFDPHTGAGFTILRNIIGSSPDNSADHVPSIEPHNPGSPSAAPAYVWDGSDQSQIWLSHQAQRYGVTQIIADAWSAPGFMKTNGSDHNGGTLCGVPDTGCASGDWRQAYADYLVKYIQDYQSEGIPLTAVDFVNEPEFGPSYASMIMTPAQVTDFIKVLRPALDRAHLTTKIACCDLQGWPHAITFANAILADPVAAQDVGLLTSHGYTGTPDSTITSANSAHKQVWETEWSTFSPFDTAWDDGSDSSGFAWASRIATGLTSANLNAFLYWWGAMEKNDNEGLIRLTGDSFTVSKRLSAFANFSRFIRPGAMRINGTVTGSVGDNHRLLVTAVRNVDGSFAVVVLNTGTTGVTTPVTLRHISGAHTMTAYLTNATNDVSPLATNTINDDAFMATIPARSLVTFVIQPH
jgi:O-glycosyl hydrolase